MTFDSGAADQGRQTVTAFFESQGDADKARTDLLAAGFPDSDIHVLHDEQAQAAAEPKTDVGIFRALLNIFVFMPENDRASYEEGLRRGGAAIAVHTDQSGYERAIDILDRDGAINLDERETVWKQEGWSPSAPRAVSAETAAFEATHGQDKLVNPAANEDVRERMGTGTANPSAGLDLAPESAVSPGAERTAIPGEESQSVTAKRDTEHGRGRVRSYIGTVAGMPTGVDPSI